MVGRWGNLRSPLTRARGDRPHTPPPPAPRRTPARPAPAPAPDTPAPARARFLLTPALPAPARPLTRTGQRPKRRPSHRPAPAGRPAPARTAGGREGIRRPVVVGHLLIGKAPKLTNPPQLQPEARPSAWWIARGRRASDQIGWEASSARIPPSQSKPSPSPVPTRA